MDAIVVCFEDGETTLETTGDTMGRRAYTKIKLEWLP